LIELLLFDIFDLPRKVKVAPLYRAGKLGARAGQIVGQYAGEQTAARIIAEGAATGPVFSQEMFDYEISAIRMGAQI
jgi:hypothetical protein